MSKCHAVLEGGRYFKEEGSRVREIEDACGRSDI